LLDRTRGSTFAAINMDNPVIIFGANFLGRAAKEIFEANGNVVYCFLDDNKSLHAKEIDNVTVLGSTDDDGYLKLIGKKCEAFIALDDNKLRKTVVRILQEERHVQPVNAVHPSAVLASSSSIGYGNFVDAGAVVGAGAEVGSHCIIQAKAVVGVETRIGDYVQIGSGSIINPGVEIEEEAFIGSGVTIISGITVGKGARVGAGSTVIGPVKAGETVFGNPAQKVNS
jgi:sugar O-acyltransferase (sialic acid O-acetyltransferase NeuD family)